MAVNFEFHIETYNTPGLNDDLVMQIAGDGNVLDATHNELWDAIEDKFTKLVKWEREHKGTGDKICLHGVNTCSLCSVYGHPDYPYCSTCPVSMMGFYLCGNIGYGLSKFERLRRVGRVLRHIWEALTAVQREQLTAWSHDVTDAHGGAWGMLQMEVDGDMGHHVIYNEADDEAVVIEYKHGEIIEFHLSGYREPEDL